MKNGKWFPGAFAAIVLTVGVVAAPREKKDIVDTAVAAGQFKTLVKLVPGGGPCRCTAG